MADEPKKKRRAKRSFTDEFRAGVVDLVLKEGKTPAQVARDLDLTSSTVRTWVIGPVPTGATASPVR